MAHPGTSASCDPELCAAQASAPGPSLQHRYPHPPTFSLSGWDDFSYIVMCPGNRTVVTRFHFARTIHVAVPLRDAFLLRLGPCPRRFLHLQTHLGCVCAFALLPLVFAEDRDAVDTVSASHSPRATTCGGRSPYEERSQPSTLRGSKPWVATPAAPAACRHTPGPALRHGDNPRKQELSLSLSPGRSQRPWSVQQGPDSGSVLGALRAFVL